MTFQDLGLCAPILTALEEQGYTQPTPIQEKAIPPALTGRDILGCAQTGTGKTCAFATPILQRLDAKEAPDRPIRALILTPTRELALQIDECFRDYGVHLDLRHAAIFGGVGQNPQVEALEQGIDILVATPGRLMDLYSQGHISLDSLKIFVLDEADRMLDMGFIHDVRRILQWLPRKKQTMLFSATMPPEIADLASSLLRNPIRVAVDPISSPVEAIQQSIYLVDRTNKTKLLAYLLDRLQVRNALVFTRTKYGANKVAQSLQKQGIPAAAIHGNKSQTARQQALQSFRAGGIRCLVATDIAARGLDIEDLSHVFNYNLPEVPETYVHRIGRTGRAGRAGAAISFCDITEQPLLPEIEKLLGHPIPRVEEHPFPMEVFDPPARDRNGRIISQEDEEARAAAREQHRERDEARKAAAKEKRQDTATAAARAAQVLAENEGAGEEKKKRRRRRKKDRAELEPAAAPEPVPVPEPEPEPEAEQSGEKKKRNRRRKKKKDALPQSGSEPEETPEEDDFDDDYEPSFRWSNWYNRSNLSRATTRPGILMDTGDAMPNTEFSRPDPLAGDSIMDATARLLAPRSSAAPAPQPEPEPPKAPEPGRKRHGQKTAAPEEQTVPPLQSPRASRKTRKKPEPPPPESPSGEKKSGRRRSRHRSRGGKGHGSPEEQGSLMKPFYLAPDP